MNNQEIWNSTEKQDTTYDHNLHSVFVSPDHIHSLARVVTNIIWG